jgi:hypothetical protein
VSRDVVLRGQIEHHETLRARGEAALSKSELKQIASQLETLTSSAVEVKLLIENLQKQELTVNTTRQRPGTRVCAVLCARHATQSVSLFGIRAKRHFIDDARINRTTFCRLDDSATRASHSVGTTRECAASIVVVRQRFCNSVGQRFDVSVLLRSCVR